MYHIEMMPWRQQQVAFKGFTFLFSTVIRDMTWPYVIQHLLKNDHIQTNSELSSHLRSWHSRSPYHFISWPPPSHHHATTGLVNEKVPLTLLGIRHISVGATGHPWRACSPSLCPWTLCFLSPHTCSGGSPAFPGDLLWCCQYENMSKMFPPHS